ncbi:MAG: hypothetical protein JO290_01470 [Sphingomonadaceae bacterium]|nr:hypothetical protein [Sphingomonadaceae bacterium]
MAGKLIHVPARAEAAEGMVLVDGPEGVALSLTPEAARRSARRLRTAARAARASEPRAD